MKQIKNKNKLAAVIISGFMLLAVVFGLAFGGSSVAANADSSTTYYVCEVKVRKIEDSIWSFGEEVSKKAAWSVNGYECQLMNYNCEKVRINYDNYFEHTYLFKVPAGALTGIYVVAGSYSYHGFNCDGVTTPCGAFCGTISIPNLVTSSYSGFTVLGEISEVVLEPTKDGYDFVDWYYDEALTVPYDGEPVYGDTQLYAKFTPITYTIKYYDGMALIEEVSGYTIESEDIICPVPTMTGYEFAGWYEKYGIVGDVIAVIPKGSTGDKMFFVKWVPTEYSITYEPNGGTMDYTTEYYTIDFPSFITPTPTRTGYTFNGWYLTSTFTGSAVTEISAHTTGDITLYADWLLTEYAINYITNGGTVSGQTIYTIESGNVTLPTPTLFGYDFKGWYDNAGFSGSFYTSIAAGSTGDRTYYAKWQIRKYTVTFYVDGEVFKEMIVEHGTTLSGLYLVNKTTLEIVPLYVNAAMTASYDLQTAIMASVELYAATDFAIYVSLTYVAGGETLTTDLLEYNSALSSLRTPELEGFDFVGWYYDKAFKTPVLSSDKLTTNTTIYAKLTQAENDMTFWKRVGNWLTSLAGIITMCVVGVAIVGGVAYGIVYKKKK